MIRRLIVLALLAATSARAMDDTNETASATSTVATISGEALKAATSTKSTRHHTPHLITEETVLRRDLEKDPENLKTLLALGNNLYWQSNYPEALAFFRKAQAIDPKSGNHLHIGVCLYHLGNLKEAADMFRAATHHQPDGFTAYDWLGCTLLRLRDTRGAVDAFTVAHRLRPNDRRIARALLRERITLLFSDTTRVRNDMAEITKEYPRARIVCAFFAGGFFAGCVALLLLLAFLPASHPRCLAIGFGAVALTVVAQFPVLGLAVLFLPGLGWGGWLTFLALSTLLPLVACTLAPNVRAHFWASGEPLKKSLAGFASSVLACMAISFAYNRLYTILTGTPMPEQPSVKLITMAYQSNPFLACLSVIVLMPLSEELIFRGYLFDGFSRGLSRRMVYVVTALLFAVAHFQGLFIVPLFLLGVVFAHARHTTGSIAIPALVHMVNNGIAVFVALYFQ